mmetsp:Transcript_6619/g.5943  ORF Transcript_6619/g.5943 Transcript_6619/m.5943 type:complete len:101 (+) Transcript_6619:2226-2528(+)
MMFSCVEYEFNNTNPTEIFDPSSGVAIKRKNLLDYYLNKTLDDMQVTNFKRAYTSVQNPSTEMHFKPFNISELITDESDVHIMDELKNLKIQYSTTSKFN